MRSENPEQGRFIAPPARSDWTRRGWVSDPAAGGTAPVGPSDAELIAAVRGGDAQAYGELWERHQPRPGTSPGS